VELRAAISLEKSFAGMGVQMTSVTTKELKKLYVEASKT